MPHRYRGGRLMLVSPPSDLGVVRISGMSYDLDELEYKAETLDGERVFVREHQLAEPDVAAFEATLGPPGAGTFTPADVARLRTCYAWVGMHGPDTGDPDGLILEAIRNPALMWGGPPEPDDALVVSTDRLRLERAPGYDWIVRIPFVAACVLAHGRAVVVNHGEPRTLAVHPDTVRIFAAMARGDVAPT